MPGKIVSIGTALPKHSFEQQEIFEFMEKAYNNALQSRKLKMLFHYSGIQKRYSVLPDFGITSDTSFYQHRQDQPDVSKRMELYQKEGLQLAIKSIENTLVPTDTSIDDITHLVPVTCTGLYAPGLGAQLIKELKLKEDIIQTPVNFMGCNAAFYALRIADLIVADNPKAKVLVVCVELCTLHFQPKDNNDYLLSNTLFGDGAASLLITSDKMSSSGFIMEGFYSLLLHEGWNHMGWTINPTSFEMILNNQVPQFIGDNVTSVVDKATKYYTINKSDIDLWCIHPGGKKILDEIASKLPLPIEELNYSYKVLREYGNMSSPTILFVLNEILNSNRRDGEKIFAVGFGPGVSIETSLFAYHE